MIKQKNLFEANIESLKQQELELIKSLQVIQKAKAYFEASIMPTYDEWAEMTHGKTKIQDIYGLLEQAFYMKLRILLTKDQIKYKIRFDKNLVFNIFDIESVRLHISSDINKYPDKLKRARYHRQNLIMLARLYAQMFYDVTEKGKIINPYSVLEAKSRMQTAKAISIYPFC